MKESLGRHRFFGIVAEGLLIPFGAELPNLLAIKADVARVPTDDIGALARAVCDQYVASDDIVQASFSQLSSALVADKPCILDAEGRSLSEITAIAGGRSDPRLVAVIYNFVDDGTQIPLMEYNPETNADILFPAIQTLFDECGKKPDALTLLRFQGRGFAVFRDDYELFDRPQRLSLTDPVWTQRFCARLASVWRFADRQVSAQHLLKWLEQFEKPGFAEEARRLLVYLYRYGYVTEQRIVAGLIGGFRALSANLGEEPIGVAFQAPGKSEARIAYKLRPEIALVTAEKALELANEIRAGHALHLACFDDCIGSGETVENYLFEKEYNPHAGEFRALFASGRVKLWVLVYHSDPRGVRRIENHEAACGAVSVRTICPLDATHQTFSDSSRLIPDQSRREAFKTFCTTIGRMLWSENPLGWGDCQWCITYDYSIPDLSLPILFMSAAGRSPWLALFPRNR